MTVSAFDPTLVDWQVFALFLEARRIHRRKTVLRVAREADVEIDAVKRAAAARNPGGREFFALAEWIGEHPAVFLKDRPKVRMARAAQPEAATP